MPFQRVRSLSLLYSYLFLHVLIYVAAYYFQLYITYLTFFILYFCPVDLISPIAPFPKFYGPTAFPIWGGRNLPLPSRLFRLIY